MSFLHLVGEILYCFFIAPVEYLIEVLFFLLFRLWHDNAGATIISLGICISLITLPLYLQADKIQNAANDKRKAMQVWERKIKKNFTGEERFMMLASYYKKVGYRQTDEIKSVLPLILQIPFFFAAYHFLSGNGLLEGSVFFAGIDLAKPDGLISVGDISVNLLPILMTFVNITASFVYTRHMTLSQKIQPVVLAVFFLVILYHSSAALVLYWLTNNLFTLGKNIVQLVFSGAGKKVKITDIKEGGDTDIVIAGGGLAVLCGFLVPVMTIASSPVDFVDPYHYISPFYYCILTFASYSGVFLFWCRIITVLLGKRGRTVLGVILYSLLITGTIVYAFMGRNLGLISNSLVYDRFDMHSEIEVVAGSFLGLAVPAVVIYLCKYKNALRNIGITIVLTCILLGLGKSWMIMHYLKSVERCENTDPSLETVVVLGKEQKNLVVIMLDRAISGYLPFIMAENPVLYDQFSGFTWYPNTVSPGACTFTGAPGLYGGYEYVPEAMEKRSGEDFYEKYGQALLLMPLVFKNAGDRVTMCDSPYENNVWDRPAEVYRSYGINNVTTKGRYVGSVADKEMIIRNFFFYSAFRTLTPVIADAVYDDGYYLSCDDRKESDDIFMASYSVLEKLPLLTSIDDGLESDSVFIIDSEITHSPHLLYTPGYIPDPSIKKGEYDYPGVIYAGEKSLELIDYAQTAHYHANAAAMLRLGEWFDYLKEKGVWDNTKIIIVSDHGADLRHFPYIDDCVSIESVNALLMVKDFDASGFRISDEFMTNADVPSIAFDGMIEEPVNPFTGNIVTADDKKNGVKVYFAVDTTAMLEKNGVDYAIDLSEGGGYRVKDDIFVDDNWEKEDFMINDMN